MQHNRFSLVLTLLLSINGILFERTAKAETPDNCSPYVEATSGSIKTVQVVPEQLLIDWDSALPCLISVVQSLKSDLNGGTLSPEGKSSLLSVTGAFRSIMARLQADDQVAGIRNGKLKSFIEKFRSNDSIDVVSVLSYGARSNDYNLRLNSMLILGNVIDNSTVCVPLTHLNDPTLLNPSEGAKGRANLLGIVSVVAPWAYKENYESIKLTLDTIKKGVNSDDPNLKSTVASLRNIDTRLNFQTDATNKKVALPLDWREACKDYANNFGQKLPNAQNLKY